MMAHVAPIKDDEIQAYVDGVLSEDRRDEIERRLETDPVLAHRMSDLFSLNSMLHERYDRILQEPTPHRLRLAGDNTVKPSPAIANAGENRPAAANLARFGGIAAAVLVGVAIGVSSMFNPQARDLVASAIGNGSILRASLTKDESFARQSAIAYVTYAPMVNRPVEVGAEQEQELVSWLSSRLGTDIHAPVLTQAGFSLMGGRLLPGDEGPIAQFMYHDAKGERITLNVSHRRKSQNITAFRLFQEGPVNVFYWVDGDFGYAVSGAIAKSQLLGVSREVYEELTARTGDAAR